MLSETITKWFQPVVRGKDVEVRTPASKGTQRENNGRNDEEKKSRDETF